MTISKAIQKIRNRFRKKKYLDCEIISVRLWDHPLTDEEITAAREEAAR